jgi:hypothetical protein
LVVVGLQVKITFVYAAGTVEMVGLVGVLVIKMLKQSRRAIRTL